MTQDKPSPAGVQLLQKERDQLNADVKRIAGERRKALDELKALNAQVLELTTKRDEANKRAKEAKAKRNEAMAKLKEITSEFAEARKVSATASDISRREAEMALEDLKHDYQKRYVPPQYEDKLIQKIEYFEGLLDGFNKASEVRRKLKEKGVDFDKMRAEGEAFHKLVLEAAKESDEFHEQIGKLRNSVREVRGKFKELNDALTTGKDKANEIHAAFVKELDSVRASIQFEKPKRERREHHEKPERHEPKEPKFDAEAQLKNVIERAKKGEKVDLTALLLAHKIHK